ncbi:MAG: biotin--[acetyl-CoA-carboxylase] ligase [Lachnospiraceae bacterium]|nr:biotin--[acetyl-CoA-carboxylase] ligase [Lachnospiraceae bacterium]
MATRDKILSLLEEHKNSYVSGAEIAEKLGLSRNAIWKAIEELRKTGYKIDAVTRRGYCLTECPDYLTEEGVRKNVIFPIEFYDEIGSTNVRAKELAIAGASSPTVVLAASQNSGNGSRNHSFYSPKGGIYLSLLLRPDEHFPEEVLSNPQEMKKLAGEAAVSAVRDVCGLELSYEKNDLYLGEKKVGGILTEAGKEYESDYIQWVVIGIGLNVRIRQEDFPEEIRERAGSLMTVKEDKGAAPADQEAPPYKESEPVMNRLASALILNLLQ